jgi:hypothetical protein
MGLISKVKVSSLDLARDAIDLVAATVVRRGYPTLGENCLRSEGCEQVCSSRLLDRQTSFQT